MTAEMKPFEKDIGTWDGEIEVRPQPGAEPQRSTGVMINRVLGGGWLVSDFKNETTGFEGRGIYGWDAAKQKYVGTWVDPMRSALLIGEGAFDESAGTITYHFEFVQGERTLRWRDITKFIDDDTQVFRSVFELAPNQHHEMVIATYRRRR